MVICCTLLPFPCVYVRIKIHAMLLMLSLLKKMLKLNHLVFLWNFLSEFRSQRSFCKCFCIQRLHTKKVNKYLEASFLKNVQNIKSLEGKESYSVQWNIKKTWGRVNNKWHFWFFFFFHHRHSCKRYVLVGLFLSTPVLPSLITDIVWTI